MRRLLLTISVLALTACRPATVPTPPTNEQPTPEPTWSSYESHGLWVSFKIKHPVDWVVIEGPQVQDVNHYVGIPVVRVHTPEGYQPGTNFADASVVVSTSLNRSELGDCTSRVTDLNLPLVQRPTTQGLPWATAMSTQGAAGNRYEQTVSRILRDGTCVELLAVIHSTNIDNFDPGTVREFDRQQVNDLLESITSSFEFVQR